MNSKDNWSELEEQYQNIQKERNVEVKNWLLLFCNKK